MFVFPLQISFPSVMCYVGTAVSRLRRPCLSLRLLLYKAISSRAEVAGGAAVTSASGPKQRDRTTFSHSNMSVRLQQFHSFYPMFTQQKQLRSIWLKKRMDPWNLREKPHNQKSSWKEAGPKFWAENWSLQWLQVEAATGSMGSSFEIAAKVPL